MGFLEKVKNMFTEEVEEDEVKVQKVDKVKKEIISSFSDEEPKEEKVEFAYEEAEEVKPVFLDDEAFDDLDFSSRREKSREKVEEEREEVEVKEERRTRQDKYARKGNYKESLKESFSKEPEEQPEVTEEKKIFKPTPIISPVYGILDKNYHKEDIVSRNERREEVEAEPSIDQVRNKAYGTLEDELENTLFGENSVLNSKTEDEEEKLEKVSIDDLDSITDDIGKELDELLVKKTKSSSKKKKTSTEDDDDLLNFIDSTLYKEEGDEE